MKFSLYVLVMFWVLKPFMNDCNATINFQSPDATPQQIRKAYYNCMKACHPDLSGDDPETTNFCKFINEVYGVCFPKRVIFFCMILSSGHIKSVLNWVLCIGSK